MRARGLKPVVNGIATIDDPSRSVRARGLKPVRRDGACACGRVALRAGAWIETFDAPEDALENIASRSVRARGLKPFCQGQ